MADPATFRCAICGEEHPGPAFAFGPDAPAYWNSERDAGDAGSRLGTETCVLQRETFFVRGLIEIPLIGVDGVFAWNVWSSLSRANFERFEALGDDPERESQPPMFGWLSTELAPVYPSTINLKLMAHLRQAPLRPLLEVEPTDHPLAIEQRSGITVERVEEINARLRHGH